MEKSLHWAHLVSFKPNPLFGGIVGWGLTVGGVAYWQYADLGLVLLSFVTFLSVGLSWWVNVVQENENGDHTHSVVSGLRYGMVLFMCSEVLFFFSFFWAFFHCSLSASEDTGLVWPPHEFLGVVVDPFSVPLLKSMLLVSSGFTVTCSHHSFFVRDSLRSWSFLLVTILLGGVFLGLQILEYSASALSFNSSSYGSTFFLLTGFHGLHVTIGVIFLSVCLGRLIDLEFSQEQHTGFEAAAWYWHFVDVVWLFLFFFLYYYGFYC